MELKSLIENYFNAADSHDIKETVRYFATSAVVYDEGKEYHGHDEIEKWLTETNAKYDTHYKFIELNQNIAKAQISGTFAGSPIILGFEFTIINKQITKLKCGV